MENLTKEQKEKIALDFMQEDPHRAATNLMFVLGKIAQRHGVNLAYSACGEDVNNPIVYRLHASTVDDKDKMEQQYFITLRYLAARNKLDDMMMDKFRQFEHKLIFYAEIPDLKKVYEDVLQEYKANKGRAHVEYRKDGYYKEQTIGIKIGDQINITLTPVTGDFFY